MPKTQDTKRRKAKKLGDKKWEHDIFIEHQLPRAGDLVPSDKLGTEVFCTRLPEDVEQALLKEDGKKNTMLMRRVLVNVVRNHPELLSQCEAELSS